MCSGCRPGRRSAARSPLAIRRAAPASAGTHRPESPPAASARPAPAESADRRRACACRRNSAAPRGADASRRSFAFLLLRGACLRSLRLHRRTRRIAALFGEDEGSPLVELGARVRAGLLVPEDLLRVELAVVLRAISEPLGVRVVVPAPLVA